MFFSKKEKEYQREIAEIRENLKKQEETIQRLEKRNKDLREEYIKGTEKLDALEQMIKDAMSKEQV